jgi:hypothetical protein
VPIWRSSVTTDETHATGASPTLFGRPGARARDRVEAAERRVDNDRSNNSNRGNAGLERARLELLDIECNCARGACLRNHLDNLPREVDHNQPIKGFNRRHERCLLDQPPTPADFMRCSKCAC